MVAFYMLNYGYDRNQSAQSSEEGPASAHISATAQPNSDPDSTGGSFENKRPKRVRRTSIQLAAEFSILPKIPLDSVVKKVNTILAFI